MPHMPTPPSNPGRLGETEVWRLTEVTCTPGSPTHCGPLGGGPSSLPGAPLSTQSFLPLVPQGGRSMEVRMAATRAATESLGPGMRSFKPTLFRDETAQELSKPRLSSFWLICLILHFWIPYKLHLHLEVGPMSRWSNVFWGWKRNLLWKEIKWIRIILPRESW